MLCIFHELYSYSSSLTDAVQTLSGLSLTEEPATPLFNNFCNSTVLASNRRDLFHASSHLSHNPRSAFRLQLQKPLQKILASLQDKSTRIRLRACNFSNIWMLHERVGDDLLRFLLTHCSLFISIGRNYIQISGLPIYNVLGRNYTPLRAVAGRRKSNPVPTYEQHAAVEEEIGPPNLKQPTPDPMHGQTQAVLHDEQARQATVDEDGIQHLPQQHAHGAMSMETVAELLTGHTCQDGQQVLFELCKRRKRRRRWRGGWLGRSSRRLQLVRQQARRRKRFQKRLSKGSCGLSAPERKLQKSISQTLQTAFRKMDVMYASHPKENYLPSFILNAFQPTKRAALKLARTILLNSPTHPIPSRTGRQNSRRKIDRVPKRLLTVVSLFQRLLENYHKMKRKMVSILNTTCPLKEELKGTQSGTDIYVKLLASSCSYEKVFKFLMCILNGLVPPELWGSPDNKACFFSHLLEFIHLRRWEKMSTRQLMHGMKPSHCSWLQLGSGCGYTPTSRSDSLKQTELLSRFITWLMRIVVDTIKGYFYVTEHSDYRNHVFYFRKPVWNKLCRMALQERSEVMLCQLDHGEAESMLMRGKTLGISNLRFLPKTSSLRPIINLGSKVNLSYTHPVVRYGQRELKSVNHQLLDLFHVLKFEKSRQPHGSSCLGYQDIHLRLKAFAEKLREAKGARSPLYFINVDVTNCFDTILPHLLYSILKDSILSQQSYLLRRYTTVTLWNTSIKRTFLKAATTRELCEPFEQFVRDLSLNSSLRNAIITDMVTYPTIDRTQLLSLLKCHLFGNIVKFRGQYYRQTKGIPQGSCVSSLLCSFYYDQMEKDHLPHVNPDTGLLMHYVDDFLLITQEADVAKCFLSTMTQGIPEYNCFINPKKTASNFTSLQDGNIEIDSEIQWMQWCGLLINTHTLEIRCDYSRYAGKKIRNNLTIISHTRPFHNLRRLIQQAIRLRCQPVFLDCEMLSEKTVLVNTYQLFLLVAVKLHAAVRALQLGRRTRRYTAFFSACIQQSTQYYYNLARNKCRKRPGDQSSFTLPPEICAWLGCHAYKTVLKLKDPSGRMYGLLVKVLSSKMASVADTMGLGQVKRCLRATSLADCRPIFRIRC